MLVGAPGDRPGVDLEALALRDVERSASVALSTGEQCLLAALPESMRLEHFYVLWTLKEAFAKALGLDLFEALTSCVFALEDGKWRGSVPVREPWSAVVCRPWPGFVLAAVVVGASGVRWNCARPPETVARELDWPVIARFGG